MADDSLIRDDYMDDSDEGFEQGDCPMGSLKDDVSLPLLVRLKKYALTPNTHSQKVMKMVQDFIRTQPVDVLANDLPEMMNIVANMRAGASLRIGLLKQLPHIASRATAALNKMNTLSNIVGDYLIPLVVRDLGFSDRTVDAVAQATLVHLCEEGYITRTQAEIQVCPYVLALSKSSSTIEVQSGAIALMSKLVHFLGRDVTERVFLKCFTELCASENLFVRKTCAATIGEFSAVVGRDAFEETLLPCYLKLCSDRIWGVRKVSVQVIMFLSCVSTSKVRKELLAPILDKLLQDDNRKVRMAAFQSLGPFISTFADPAITKIGYTKGGNLVLIDGEGGEFEKECISDLTLTDLLTDYERDETQMFEDEFVEHELLLDEDFEVPKHPQPRFLKKDDVFGFLEIHENSQANPNWIIEKQCDNLDEKIDRELRNEMENLRLAIDNERVNSSGPSEPNCDREKPEITISVNNVTNNDDNKVNFSNSENTIEDDLHLFNSYNYWYVSPDLPLDPSIISDVDPKGVIDAVGDMASNLENLYATISLNDTFNGATSTTSTMSLEEENISTSENEQPPAMNVEPPQNVVPQFIIDKYILMTDLSLNVDREVTFHCAYFLPAIVLTLGKENWHLLKNTLECLAGDMQYNVRRTVASSLHELAQILGPDLATNDLTPVFDGFIRDLDEVRIGILEHLTHFLRLINVQKRITYLPRLKDFLRTENEWNWRLREELAQQMLEAVTLFKPSDTAKYIGAVAIDLLCDKIAAVREISLTLITKILGYTPHALTASLLVKLAENLAHSKKWKRRQTFCLLCIELLRENALKPEQFASEIMPHLLDLSWDPVVNIRLVVARCLSRHILKNEYFSNPENENCEGLETVVKRLQADKDRDVRQSAEIFYYIS